MKVRASAPGKIILFGEHFVVYGVKAILCAIDRRITVVAEKIPEEKISIKSDIGELEMPINNKITDLDSPLKPLFYIAKKMIERYDQNSGVNIIVESQIPLGVGLGSSSACCVAGAAAISKLFTEYSREQILELAIEAEKTIFQNTSGADCTVCTFGGLMEYDKKNGFSEIKLKPNFQLVIINSNIIHSTKTEVSNVKQFKDNNEKEFFELCSKESNLINKVKVMLKENDLPKLGKSMLENQEYLEAIGISNQNLSEMVQIAKETSFGAKITGAGGGGCIIALTDKLNSQKTILKFREKNYQCFSVKIDFKGLNTF